MRAMGGGSGLSAAGATNGRNEARPQVGLDALRDNPDAVRARRLGVVTNQTGVDARFTSTPQVLAGLGAQVAALFGPEHGYDGAVQDALAVGHSMRRLPEVGEVPVYSLYRSDGDFGVPHPEGTRALQSLDLLVFDIQDVGARYYTYLSTLGVMLEAAAEAGLPLLVLDRPNPLGGQIEGPPLEDDCRSFVGRYNVPVRHGLTMGEAARYINEHYLGGRAEVLVEPVRGWRRDLLFPQTGLAWVPPSPNIPTFDTAAVYPGTCLLEGTTMTEGRGTTRPFEIVGAPWIEADEYAAYLNGLDMPGVRFRGARFMPAYDRYAGQLCEGVQVYPTDLRAIRPVVIGLHLVVAAKKLYPHRMAWREPPPGGLYHFDRLIGSKSVRAAIDAGVSVEEITGYWLQSERAFAEASASCLLYA